MRRDRFVLVGLAFGLLSWTAERAWAQGCSTTNAISSLLVPGNATASHSFNDTAMVPDPLNSTTWVVKGNTLYGLWNVSGNGHFANGQHASVSFSYPIAGDPVLLQMNGQGPGDLSVIVANQDGYIYRKNLASGSSTFASVWQYDTRRPTCSTDTLFMTPVVLLQQYFGGVDRIIYGTRRTCSATGTGNFTENVIVCLNGAGQMLWQTNPNGSMPLDYITGCTVDDTASALYCTANRPLVANQPTVIKINLAGTPTTPSGTIVSVAAYANAGAIAGTPSLMPGGKLYLVTKTGTLKALSAATLQNLGADIALTGGVEIASAYIETRVGGGTQGAVFATDANGYVHGKAIVIDTVNGNTATNLWASFLPAVMGGGSTQAADMPAFDAVRNKLYVPTINGHVLQYNRVPPSGPGQPSQPILEADYTVGTGPVTRVTLDYEGSDWSDQPNRFSVIATTINGGASGGTNIRRLCAPAGYGASGGATRAGSDVDEADGADPLTDTGTNCTDDSGCTAATWNTVCTVGRCMKPDVAGLTGGVNNANRGVCVAVPKAAKTPCSEGCLLSGQGECMAGVCVPKPGVSNSCTCGINSGYGGAGCDTANHKSCCGAAGCVNLETDRNNCGHCGNVCDAAAGLDCFGGSCGEPQCSTIPSVSALERLARTSNGANNYSNLDTPSAITYTRLSDVTKECGVTVGEGGFTRPGGYMKTVNSAGNISRVKWNAYGYYSIHPYTDIISDRRGLLTGAAWNYTGYKAGYATPKRAIDVDRLTSNGLPFTLNYQPPTATVPFTNTWLDGPSPVAMNNAPPFGGSSSPFPDVHMWTANWNGTAAVNGAIYGVDFYWDYWSLGDWDLQGVTVGAYYTDPLNRRITALETARVPLANGTTQLRLYYATYETSPTIKARVFQVVGGIGTEVPLYPSGSARYATRVMSMRQSNAEMIVSLKNDLGSYDVRVVRLMDFSSASLNERLTSLGQATISVTQDAVVAAFGRHGLLLQVPQGGAPPGTPPPTPPWYFKQFNFQPWIPLSSCPTPSNPCEQYTMVNGLCYYTTSEDYVACNDGNPCTIGELCEAGDCMPYGWAAAGTPCTDPKNTCLITGQCTGTNATCQAVTTQPNGYQPCSVNSLCFTNNWCYGGYCEPGDFVSCPYGCNALTGCL